ncbi:UNVERIFIED_CONTAM: hypothetical protein PYX00_011874 [Menopon gallinae]|uniref:Bacterial surface antigen (D15) domain-containing protein n=1 Tax=Menopon gallinae TaxID=328185 RepID=A0AAW2H906_9NEOP
MKKMEARRRQIVPSRPKNTPLHRLINDYDRPIEISPVHVLIISLLFIANVFLLHLYARFGSGSSLYQVIFAAMAKWYPEMLFNFTGPPEAANAENKRPAGSHRFPEEKKHRNVKLGIEVDRLNNITGFCNISLPRLFAKNRSIEIKYSANQDSRLLFRTHHGNSTAELSLFRSFFRTPGKRFEAVGFSSRFERLSSAVELRADLRELGVLRLNLERRVGRAAIRCQAGLNTAKGTLFSKLELSGATTASLHRNIYNKIDWGIGVIKGDVHVADRFFLGSNVWGYKPQSVYPSVGDLDGGVSFLEVTDSLGVRSSGFDFFVFSSMGFCSQQSNIAETITSCFLSLFCDTKPKCLGLSVGAGVSSPIVLKGFEERRIQARFSIPLTSNPDTEVFKLSVVADL